MAHADGLAKNIASGQKEALGDMAADEAGKVSKDASWRALTARGFNLYFMKTVLVTAQWRNSGKV